LGDEEIRQTPRRCAGAFAGIGAIGDFAHRKSFIRGKHLVYCKSTCLDGEFADSYGERD
jgi:hypothetical protein